MNANGKGQNRIQGVGFAPTKLYDFESTDFFSVHPFPIGVPPRGVSGSLGLHLVPQAALRSGNLNPRSAGHRLDRE